MQDINRIVLVGRLTKDCGSDPNGRDFGYIQQTGTCKAVVSIAVNKPKKQGDQWVENVYYFDVVIWGRTAENLKPYLVKGQQILVDGSLVQDRWEKDGQKQSRIYINSESVQLVGGKRGDVVQQGQQNSVYNGYNPPKITTGMNYQQNGMAQVQQMAGQPIQTRQPQPMLQDDGMYGGDFPEDIPF